MVMMGRIIDTEIPPELQRASAPAANTTAAASSARPAAEPAANGIAVDAAAGGEADTRSDVEEARRAAGGDIASFERLYHRHSARIHSLARRMLGAAEADEATQEVFTRAWEKLGSFRGEAAFGSWLYRLDINAILAIRTSSARRRDRFHPAELVLETARARPLHSDLRLDLERAIEQLPDGARQVFTLYDIEGYRHEEIGSLLGITAGTSKSQLHRARMMLRAHLKR
jgi:RNA polymerase sigma-70 factor (ECF subfamily)